jgi:hypothetical protein
MKLRPTILLSVLLGFFMGVRTAPAQQDAAVRQELEAQYLKLAEAHEGENLQAILALKTPDFHAIFPDGKVGDTKTMREYSKQFLEANQPPYNIRVTIQGLAVSENGLIAVAEVLQEVTRQRELAGKLRSVDTSVLQRETWARTPEGWKLKSVDNVRDQKRFVDGKRVDPTKPYDPDAAPYSPGESAKPTP